MSSTPYNYQKSANGVHVTDNMKIQYTSNHQISIEGSAGSYTIKFKPVGGTVFKDFENNAVSGTGNSLIVPCRAEAFEITPPDGANYSVIINGLDVA